MAGVNQAGNVVKINKEIKKNWFVCLCIMFPNIISSVNINQLHGPIKKERKQCIIRCCPMHLLLLLNKCQVLPFYQKSQMKHCMLLIFRTPPLQWLHNQALLFHNLGKRIFNQ